MAGQSGDKEQWLRDQWSEDGSAAYGYCRCCPSRRSRHECYFQKFSRVPATGMTLMLDNCSIHKATKSLTKIGLPTIKETAVKSSIALQYAVPYDPYLNPVEYVFQSIKQHLNKVQPRTALELRGAITTGIKAYKPSSLKALFQRVIQNDGRVGA